MSTLREISRQWNIPLVKAHEINGNIDEVMSSIRQMEGVEGFVFRFPNGMMYKCKTELYCSMHTAKDGINFEKNVLGIVVNEQTDDHLALLYGDDKERLEKFNNDVLHQMMKKADELFWIAQAAFDNYNGSKRDFSIKTVQNHSVKNEHGILFKIWDMLDDDGCTVQDAYELVRKTVINHSGASSTQTKVNSIRNLFGNLNWYDYFQHVDMDG